MGAGTKVWQRLVVGHWDEASRCWMLVPRERFWHDGGNGSICGAELAYLRG